MMMHTTLRARWVRAAAIAAGMLAFSGCNVREELLSPQQPGTILPGRHFIGAGAAGAEALRVGALGRFQQLVGRRRQRQPDRSDALRRSAGRRVEVGRHVLAAQRDGSARDLDEQHACCPRRTATQSLARLLSRRDRRAQGVPEPDTIVRASPSSISCGAIRRCCWRSCSATAFRSAHGGRNLRHYTSR